MRAFAWGMFAWFREAPFHGLEKKGKQRTASGLELFGSRAKLLPIVAGARQCMYKASQV